MKHKIIILPTMLLFLACNEHRPNETTKARVTDTLTVAKKDTPAKINTSPNVVEEDFNAFWKTFRNTVLLSDTSQLLNFCSFPFKYRGPFDEDPTVNLSRTQFNKVFSLFLKQWDGLDLEGATELDYIKKTVQPSVQANETEIRVGDMVFYKKSGKWELGFIYLNEDTIDILKKNK